MTDVAGKYDHFQISFETLEKEKKYLNYGYSLNPHQTLEDKQEQLCKEVFKLANIQHNHIVVDVGFGSGEQDFLLADLYPFSQLIGFNISQRQVEYANYRAGIKNLGDRMIFYRGEAERMERIADSSVDRVLAIECAFYFDRPRFYKEAARILKKGGYLVLSDITLGPRLKWLADNSPKYKRAGTLKKNKKQWEYYFQTKLIKNISNVTKQGAQESVFQILRTLPKIDQPLRGDWLQLALSSQLVALGLRLHLIQYHLILLEKVKNTFKR
ncbi:MAG: class I SAM-dependent methyltransferase [Candidatus Marinimicrobia bacterium]|nr:class I SAM-dependent methyltransferase [Candidatus Neomarinimicrobiota bacterium]